MKFFNVNRAKQIIGNTAQIAFTGFAISSPFVAVYSMCKRDNEKYEILNKYGISSENPNNRYRYDHEEVTCRGWTGEINGRIVDKETGTIVARCP